MRSLFILLFLEICSFSQVESVFQYHKLILEPIYRFTDTAAVPMKSIYFTKLPQFLSVTQNTQQLNISQFNAVRGPTQEMFLKDLGCGIDTCQNLPIKVTPVFNVIDSKGRLKFETSPTGTDIVLGKAGYLATDQAEGLIRYDEYYSEDSDMFAYTNGKFPNQFGACQLKEYGRYRYKFVRTLGYAFTAVEIPENLPIYSIIGFDDGLPEPSTAITTTLSPSQYVFTTTPIWTILKNSTNTTQGVGSINLPWTPPVSASPIESTNVCLLNGNFSILSRCGSVEPVLQFYDNSHVYIGFIDLVYGTVDTYIYSYIGYAFRSIDNNCGIPLEPIREMYKKGVGFTVVAGDVYPELTSQGFAPTGNIIGYTIDCDSAPNGEIVIEIPYATTPTYSSTSPTPTSISTIGFYVEPIKIVSESSGGQQGYWLDPSGTSSNLNILETSNVCIFTANNTVIPRCGYARNLYLYYDIEDHFYFVSLYTFGRNVTGKVIGVAFETDVNSCGLNLVPIRELYKEGVGYQVVAGDEYSSLLKQGFNITGNIVGYTVNCKASKDNFVYGELPDYEFSTIPPTGTSDGSTTPSTPTTPKKRTDGLYVEQVYIVGLRVPGGKQGYWSGYMVPAPIINNTNVCVFTANQTAYKRCGLAKTLYLYYDRTEEFYFIGIESFGRPVDETTVIGHAFPTDENVCGLNLVPMKEYYKEGTGYYINAGDNDSFILSAGYTPTGNIMGYTVDCKDSIGDFVYGNIPDYDFTTHSIPSTSTESPNSKDLAHLFVSPLYNVTRKPDGILGSASAIEVEMSVHDPIPVCIFPSNESFLPFCGDTKPLYQYYDLDSKFYFIGIQDFGRRVLYTRIGTAFTSSDNICELKLKPMRELFKRNVGYTVVAGDNYAKLVSEGYTLTGNILGYTVRCKESKDKMICANFPSNWTTTTKTTTFTTTTTVTKTPTTTTTTQKPTTTPYDLKAPLPKLDCDTIENYGDLRWRMVQFSRYMEIGDNFTMTGHIWRNATESSLNMYVGLAPKWLQSKISIHVNVRWWRSDIIYNYFWGAWDYRYETFSRRPFSKGMPYTLSLVRGTNYYLVYGNGELIKKYWIVGDVKLHKVGGFMGFREWTIDTVQMDCVRPSTVAAISTTTNPTSTTKPTTFTSTTVAQTTPTSTRTTVTTKSIGTTTATSTISSTTSLPPTTTPYNLSASLPKLDCNTIEFYGDLRWRPINFGRIMEIGDNITITGHIWKNATQSNVNFYLGFNPKFGSSMIPVHMSQRWASSQNIYNNYWNAWGAEAYSSRPFTRGNPFVLSVVKTSSAHYIYGNGQLLIKFWYRGTASQNQIGSVIVYNDWTVDKITMTCARPPTTSTPTTVATTPTTTTKVTTTTPKTTSTVTTKVPSFGNCTVSSIELGQGDSNDPQFEIDVSYETAILSGNEVSLTIFCKGLPNYNVYMVFNGNQGGPPPNTDGRLDIQLGCSSTDQNGSWTYFGREITAIHSVLSEDTGVVMTLNGVTDGVGKAVASGLKNGFKNGLNAPRPTYNSQKGRKKKPSSLSSSSRKAIEFGLEDNSSSSSTAPAPPPRPSSVSSGSSSRKDCDRKEKPENGPVKAARIAEPSRDKRDSGRDRGDRVQGGGHRNSFR